MIIIFECASTVTQGATGWFPEWGKRQDTPDKVTSLGNSEDIFIMEI